MTTEWDAQKYDRSDALQKGRAEHCLSQLELKGSERVLDIGCGNGRITAEVAGRLPGGSVVGIDQSSQMIEFAKRHYAGSDHANLTFAVADAAALTYRDEFDLIISFNSLHWVHDQLAALRGMQAALKASGRAFLNFVPAGRRKCIEDILEERRSTDQWARRFHDFQRPFVPFTPEEYRVLAVEAGFQVERIERELCPWDFGTRQKLSEWVEATFILWVQRIPEQERPAFINEVLDHYGLLDGLAGEELHVFYFYQMEVMLKKGNGDDLDKGNGDALHNIKTTI